MSARLSPWSGSTASFLFWGVVFLVVVTLGLTGLTPRELYYQLRGAREAFTEQDAALLTAAREGDLEGVRLALASGARVNAVEPDGFDTALVRAARFDHADIVEALLQAGADHTRAANGNRTALHEAVEKASPDVVGRLLAVKPDVNRFGGGEDRTPLAAAVMRYGDAAPAPRKPADEAGMSAALQVIRLLLEAGASPALGEGGKAGRTPLAIAVQRGLADVAMALLGAGADARAVDTASGDTLLAMAVDTCAPTAPAIVAALVSRGADPDARGPSGRSARERLRGATTSRDDCGAILKEMGTHLVARTRP
jgi:hypothetical protein